MTSEVQLVLWLLGTAPFIRPSSIFSFILFFKLQIYFPDINPFSQLSFDCLLAFPFDLAVAMY